MGKKKGAKPRNETARAAWERGGAGTHQTSKTVVKSKGSSRRQSIGDQLNGR